MSHNVSQLIPRVIGGLLEKTNPQHEAKRQLSWIQDCLENHTICNRDAQVSSFLPTRLVDVECPSSIRLLNSNAIVDSDRRYVALSYCWGDSMPESGRTTLSSLAAHQLQINLRELPKTLREAIEVTRSLSMRYIWIDALCIIQDDETDRDREIETMAQVYSCATVTIAAQVSPHCEGGFLMAKRFPFRPFAKFRPAETRGSRLKETSWEPYFFSSHLFRRGWTLQERELSTRVLHFTNDYVVFECRQGIRRYDVATASDYPSSLPLEHRHQSFSRTGVGRQRILDWGDGQRTELESKKVDWRRVVEEYSWRRLTDHNDRLPAIAGLADAVQNRFGWNYVAGLWAENLAHDLLWIVNFPHEVGMGETYLAPSWSWAATNSPIRYDLESSWFTRSTEVSIEIIEVKVQSMGSNEKGKLSGGLLKARGRLKRIAGSVMNVNNRDCRTAIFSIERGGDELDIYWDRKSEIESDEEVAILPVLQNDKIGFGNGLGLVLRKAGVDGVYRRVGLSYNTRLADFRILESVEVTII